ncbi:MULTISPECIES: o-succinylbenzoate--CoA ligase [Clostridia]|uniref:o-succinylbenzoate--CoA ligase n=1 Tax=Clostridia TaxID=186801 RepID=UPI000EA3F097|nr:MULTISPECIES: o-succinylbenzoate--CoA ligase [Clostridia]NBJ69288.1 o-succinylbenzoate--CoA ligase [Roseburia sp. 1XD42-34]RKI79253.1 o-succinylbenzoate--CoA ligase [Clostridium sp. 1xD42-85]
MQTVIPHWLTKQADISPDQIALQLSDGSTLTFQQLKEQSQDYAKKLAGWGVMKGTHVAVLSSNQPTMVIAIHALSYLEAVVVLLNSRLTGDELTYQLKDAEVSFLIYTETLAELAGKLPVSKALSLTAVECLQPETTDIATEINLGKPFTMMYTSGTTGFPKGVVHTYGNHWWSAIGSALNLGLQSEDKWLAALPLFHVSGLSILIRSVIYGMPVYLLEKFDKQRVHQAIMTKGITMVSVVTVMLQQLLDELGGKTYPDSLRCMLLGGGPAPKPLLEQAKEKGVPVFQSFGMTETASQIVTLNADDALKKIGSAGKALFPAQVKINAPDEDGVGEIYVKGPMVTDGYYKNQAATEKAIIAGWLATGDLGYLDKEGYLYVIDRRNDLIISGGENVYPSEIESTLLRFPGIKEAGVTGAEDAKWGEVPVAFIVTDHETYNQAELQAFLNRHLAAYKCPKQIYEVDRLPRNASNKLVRRELKKLL